MRIIHHYGASPRAFGLTDAEFLAMNGGETHFWNQFLRSLKGKPGYYPEVHIETSEGRRKTVEIDGLPFQFWPSVRFHRRISVPFGFVVSLVRKPPGLFVFYGSTSNPVSWLIALWLRAMRVQYVVQYHGGQTGGGFLERNFFRAAAGVVTPLEDTKRDLGRKFSIPEEKLHAIPSGIDDRRFTPAAETASRGESICFAGRLTEEKGFKLALETFVSLSAVFPDLTFDVAGEFLDDRTRSETTGILERKGLLDRVNFRGWVEAGAMGEFYSKSAVLVLPSRSESFSRAAVEAMMCGTVPVVLHGSGGPSIFLKDGETGLVVTEENIGDRLKEILGRKDILARIAGNARRFAVSNFSIRASSEAADRLYASLLQKRTKERIKS